MKAVRNRAASAGLTGILGITEPVLYGINLRFIYPLIGAMIGGGVGGLFLGVTGVGRYASGSPGLLVLPGYIGGEGLTNFYLACVGTVIAMVVRGDVRTVRRLRKAGQTRRGGNRKGLRTDFGGS